MTYNASLFAHHKLISRKHFTNLRREKIILYLFSRSCLFSLTVGLNNHYPMENFFLILDFSCLEFLKRGD